MSSPFPGMDPYLEDSEHWRGFHSLLAGEILRQLNPLIVPKYYADLEVHAVVEEVSIVTRHDIYPDAAVVEVAPQQPAPQTTVTIPEAPLKRAVPLPERTKLRTVNVYLTATKELVTTIEILSPANKMGEDLQKYRQKRSRLLRSPVHLVEIDLLRSGERPGWELNTPPLDTDYVILVNRASDSEERTSEIWPIALNEPLPTVPVPLFPPDADVPLDLAAIFENVYNDAHYELRIDYSQPVPPPPLRPEMEAWWTERIPEPRN